MNLPTNPILTRAEIRDVLLAHGFRPKEGDDLRPYVYAAADALVCAVIDRLGASGAVPVAEIEVTEHHAQKWRALRTQWFAPGTHKLYDATALAQARQRGRNEGREDARSEFAKTLDDVESSLRRSATGGNPGTEMPRWARDAMSVIDAARQPTQKE